MGRTKVQIDNQIRTLRFHHREMTQQELADQVGVTRQTVNAIEGGKYFPSLEVAFQIARVFGKPLEEVFQFVTSAGGGESRHGTPGRRQQARVGGGAARDHREASDTDPSRRLDPRAAGQRNRVVYRVAVGGADEGLRVTCRARSRRVRSCRPSGTRSSGSRAEMQNAALSTSPIRLTRTSSVAAALISKGTIQ